MDRSKVYFTDMRAKPGSNMLDKLSLLVKKAGIESIDFNKKFVALKIHFGEPGNLAYIRPNYAAVIVKLVKELGGKPYLTDSNTLYKGRRDNAVSHLESANENGFSPLTVGCNLIIADGIKGTEYREIEINMKYCKTAKIGSAIADSDVLISLNHFKGHEMTGFGGALKNIGMGSGSIGGKLEMHSNSQPVISVENCVGCGICVRNCNVGAITVKNKKAVIDYNKCVGCGQCVAVCQYDAAQVRWGGSGASADDKIAEYAYAVLMGRPSFHVNFIMNVSPNCDCWNMNDAAIIPDLGIMASFDPVALDAASIEMVNKATIIPGSCLDEKKDEKNVDKFKCVHPSTDWKRQLLHAEEIGLGSRNYELIKI